MILVIDPGHGGRDSGAVSHNVAEKDINLLMGLELAQTSLTHGWTPLLTRYTDKFISLQDRALFANAIGADCFISLHCNASEAYSVYGSEIYTSPGSTSADPLAECTMEAIIKRDPGQDIRRNTSRKIGKEARFSVLIETIMPAILLEPEFLTNAVGWKKLTSAAWRMKTVEAVADGIEAWMAG